MNDPSLQLLEKIKALQNKIDHMDRLESGLVVARYQTNAGQSIANNLVAIVDFEDKIYDTHNAVTIGASWHFHAPVGGYYAVAAGILFSSTNTWADGEDGQIQIFKNGAAHSYIDRKDNYGSAASVYMHLAATETIDIRIFQTSGGALTLHNDGNWNYVSVWKI
jgi:hypothetical protein